MSASILFVGASCLLGFLLTAALFALRQYKHRVLGVYILCFALVELGDVLRSAPVLGFAPSLALLFDWCCAMLPPLALAYVRAELGLDAWRAPKWILHLLPAALLLLISLPVLLLPDALVRQIVAESIVTQPHDPLLGLLIAQAGLYVAAVLRVFHTAIRHGVEIAASSRRKAVGVVMGSVAIWSCWAWSWLFVSEFAEHMTDIGYAAGVCALAFLELRDVRTRTVEQQPVVDLAAKGTGGGERREAAQAADSGVARVSPEPAGLTTGEQGQPSLVVPKYARAIRSPDVLQALARKLEAGMREHRWYRDESLSLSSLAHHLGASPHSLSQVLNQELKQSFAEYVCGLRLNEVKSRLRDSRYDGATIFAIALDCGFASKAAFNAAFKRDTGMSPTLWRRQARSPSIATDSESADCLGEECA